ncbi:MAG TPA: hypothetical protein VLE73_01175 [Candidatus Saccharimonadales bacterium]|nr:hypothetical protein [Candidatus Saccharimonadales bacterium]
MTFEPCKQPAPTDLALTNPKDTLGMHQTLLDAQHRYWSNKEVTSGQAVDLARHTLAHTMHQEIWNITRTHIAHTLGARLTPTIIEQTRRRGLRAIAVSVFLRRLIKPDEILDDGLAQHRANLIVDMFKDDADMPLDARIHALPQDGDKLLPVSTAEDQWYRKGNLYVRRTILAEPTDAMQLWAHEHNMSVPFNELISLLPYIASKH